MHSLEDISSSMSNLNIRDSLKFLIEIALKIAFIALLLHAAASFLEVCHSLTGVVGFSYLYSIEFQTLSSIDFRNTFILTFQ